MHGPYPIGGAQWWLRDGADLAATRRGIERAQAALASGALVDRKNGRRKGLFALRLEGPTGSEATAPADHLLKRNAYAGLSRLRRRFLGSKARIELQRAEQAAERSIPTPIPLAAGEVHRHGVLDHCLLLMPILDGATDLRVLWEQDHLTPSERRELARTLGHFTRSFLESGLFQDDFAPNNLLIRLGTPSELWVIDFERVVLREQVSPGDRARMLAKLQREMVGRTRSDELRFLQGFSHNDRSRWLRRVSEEAPGLLAKDLAHLERTLRRPGRRFRPVRDGSFGGWMHREAPLSLLRRIRDATNDPHERHDLPPLPASLARRTFATAILLGRRGLGPQPLALWTSRDRACLVYDPASVAHGLPDASASRALLRRLLALAELETNPRPAELGLATSHSGRPMAAWMAPERLLITGAATPPERLHAILQEFA